MQRANEWNVWNSSTKAQSQQRRDVKLSYCRTQILSMRSCRELDAAVRLVFTKSRSQSLRFPWPAVGKGNEDSGNEIGFYQAEVKKNSGASP